MAQQQAIKLKIAGKSYSFTLKHEANEEQSLAEKEELYRLAEREVNATFKIRLQPLGVQAAACR